MDNILYKTKKKSISLKENLCILLKYKAYNALLVSEYCIRKCLFNSILTIAYKWSTDMKPSPIFYRLLRSNKSICSLAFIVHFVLLMLYQKPRNLVDIRF